MLEQPTTRMLKINAIKLGKNKPETAIADIQNTKQLREPNSIIVLLFVCIYIGLRVNACIVNKTFKEAICIFALLA